MPRRSRQPRNGAAHDPTPPTPPAPANPREPAQVKARMADTVIRITTPAGVDNPYRPGTDAHRHFECMKGGITKRDYLCKFTEAEHRTASQWLYNAHKAGFIRLYGG